MTLLLDLLKILFAAGKAVLSKVPWWAYPLALLLAWGWHGHQTVKARDAQIVKLKAQMTDERTKWNKMVADEKAAAKAAADRAAADAQAMQQAKEKADATHKLELATTARRLAAERAVSAKLRAQLAAVASGNTTAAGDSVAACRERAASLGDVLGSVLSDYARCTAAAEDNAAGVRALLDGWPRVPSQSTTNVGETDVVP